MSIALENYTPFPSMRFSNTDNRGLEFGVLMIKAAFDIREDGACVVSPEQEPFNFTDATHGELNLSSLRHPSDLVAYKPATDIHVDAVAHAPGGQANRTWLSGIAVSDQAGTRVEKQVRVTGPRWWHPRWRRSLTERERENWRDFRYLFQGWELTEPTPTLLVPIRYEHAYGGSISKGLDSEDRPIIEAYEYNPIGCGWIDPDYTDHTQPVRAPQIESPNELITAAGQHYAPCGLGPIPPAWLPRRLLGGTFDQNWIDKIWPKWPPDYDFAYNNSACPGLSAAPHLSGSLNIVLKNVRPACETFVLQVPDTTPLVGHVSLSSQDSLTQPLLDTIMLDIAPDNLFDCRLQMTWRMTFSLADTSELHVILPSAERRFELMAERGLVLPAPRPSDCASASIRMEVTS